MVLNFAHRGSLTEAPENTLPAIKKALEHQTKAIELDVQLTKDQQLVVIHDQKLTRFNALHTKPINWYTLDEIRQIDVGSAFSKSFAGTTLSTLEEILAICPQETMLNIEIKNIPVIHDGIERILLECLKEHDRTDHLIISSFDHLALHKIQMLAPDIPLGMLFYYRILRPWNYARSSGLTITSLHPHMAYTDDVFVEESHKHGYKVFPFTVNDINVYNRLLESGVDGVFSNNPKIFSASGYV